MIDSGVVKNAKITELDQINTKALICLNEEISNTVLVSSVDIGVIGVGEFRGYLLLNNITSDIGSVLQFEVADRRSRFGL
jgi:hypothetical protein